MPTKLIHHFPPPLLDDLVKGRWLPVVGAGMSRNAIVPSRTKMPLWADLGNELSKEIADYSSSGTLDAISAYEHEFGRAKLIERLSELLLVKESQPGNAHKGFCSIPFDIVYTTNFDFLLERQYEASAQYVYPVVDEEQLSVFVGNPGTLLLKIHGDLHHPSRLVVTESDYDGFLFNHPLLSTYIANQLITRTAVFFGYSLDDPDFRQIWHIVSERLGRTRRVAYVVLVNARSADISRYERRGVKVVNLPGPKDKYGDILSTAFAELRDYRRDNMVSVSRITEEQSLRELLLPRDSTTRLCYFALPVDLLSFYRLNVFPLVEEIGLVPATVEDVIAPGDSINAIVDVMIDRASIMVIDLSSQLMYTELRKALLYIDSEESRGRKLQIIAVLANGQATPTSIGGYRYVPRPESLLTDESETFVQDLIGILKEVGAERIDKQEEEPWRLFTARNYRAAVISSMTTLELSLRKLSEDIAPTLGATTRPTSLGQLVGRANKMQFIDRNEREEMRAWINLRNLAVHTARDIERNEAKSVLEGVSAMLRRLEERRRNWHH